MMCTRGWIRFWERKHEAALSRRGGEGEGKRGAGGELARKGEKHKNSKQRKGCETEAVLSAAGRAQLRSKGGSPAAFSCACGGWTQASWRNPAEPTGVGKRAQSCGVIRCAGSVGLVGVADGIRGRQDCSSYLQRWKLGVERDEGRAKKWWAVTMARNTSRKWWIQPQVALALTACRQRRGTALKERSRWKATAAWHRRCPLGNRSAQHECSSLYRKSASSAVLVMVCKRVFVSDYWGALQHVWILFDCAVLRCGVPPTDQLIRRRLCMSSCPVVPATEAALGSLSLRSSPALKSRCNLPTSRKATTRISRNTRTGRAPSAGGCPVRRCAQAAF